jgi:hypothetical protein
MILLLPLTRDQWLGRCQCNAGVLPVDELLPKSWFYSSPLKGSRLNLLTPAPRLPDGSLFKILHNYSLRRPADHSMPIRQAVRLRFSPIHF